MRILFWITVIFSGIVSIGAFLLTNMTTAVFDPAGDHFVGGNGNVGLMFVAFPSLIILYFFFAMMFVFERLHEHFAVNRARWQAIYAGAGVAIIAITVLRVVSFKHEIQPYFNYDVGYLNAFSNHLFFNGWTFIACLSFSAFCSFYLKKSTQKRIKYVT